MEDVDGRSMLCEVHAISTNLIMTNGLQWVQWLIEPSGNPCNAGKDIDPGSACMIHEV